MQLEGFFLDVLLQWNRQQPSRSGREFAMEGKGLVRIRGIHPLKLSGSTPQEWSVLHG